jgi:Holliday junction resolvase RusA-like endonuclease
MKSARFVLPLPPSVNASYKQVKKHMGERTYSKRVATEALDTFKESAPFLLYQQGLIRGSWEGVKAVGYELTIYTATNRSDGSNRLKAYEDAVSQYLGFDDRQVMEGQFKKVVDKNNPRIEGNWFTLESEDA